MQRDQTRCARRVVFSALPLEPLWRPATSNSSSWLRCRGPSTPAHEMTTRKLRPLFSLTLVAATALLTSCSATGKFKSLGEPPMWKDVTELPVPDDGSVDPNTLRVVLQCPTVEEDEEFIAALKESIITKCRTAGMGEVKLLPRGSTKKAHYEIMVYEAGEDGKFDFNEEAGIWSGLGTGVATGILTESIGGGIVGGAVGAGAAGLLFGDKKEVYAFAGVCRQRTSVETDKTASTGNNNRNATGGGIKDQDTGTKTNSTSGREVLERAQWNLKTRSYEFPFMFNIAVDGGAMTNKGKRDAAARETFLKKFPTFVTGGTSIGG